MALDDFREQLAATAAALAAPGTGLLAADESTGTIGQRFAAIGLENSEEHRRAYRSLLATTAGLAETISGVILFEETLFQNSSDAGGGAPIVELFQRQGIIPGHQGGPGGGASGRGSGGRELVLGPERPG
jgi:fructose-bisphosphate aldolase class I